MTAVALHQIFDEVARRWPDHTAVEAPPSESRPERQSITYSELRQRSDALAWKLAELISEPDRIVIVLLPRASVHLYLSQLAILKAGAAFASIDCEFPDDQVQTIIEDAQAAVVLTDAAGCERASRLAPGVPALDVIAWASQNVGIASATPSAPWLAAHSLAYLIYTSGTSGRPKGVMIEHRSIVNLVCGDLATLGVTPDDRVAQNSSPAYDSSIEETWFALAAGATLVVLDEDTVRLGPDLVPWLRRERITMFCPAPTLLRSTGCVDPGAELPELRLLHPGGEALTQDVADRWSAGRRLVNDYGPTEATITALRGVIEPGMPVSIGKPVPGMQAWVLDIDLQELPEGTQGELCLGGVGLSRGYHNEPVLTASKFPTHPLFGRIYRTGDLASRDRHGNFFCHGRIDGQVKIRGYRIELEAVETRLAECAGVREAVCAVQGNGASRRLVAFIVPEDIATPPPIESLTLELRKVLPVYMVPVQFGYLRELPRSTSSKLDRRALPSLHRGDHDAVSRRTGPQNATEAVILAAVEKTFELAEPVSVHDDFFHVLGGDSLASAILISLLREDRRTASLTVRDVYEARTIASLAERARVDLPPAIENPARDRSKGVPHSANVAMATCIQVIWVLSGLLSTAWVAYAAVFWLLPAVMRYLGLVTFTLLLPVFYIGGMLTYAAAAVVAAVGVKRALIGKYAQGRFPAWGNFHVRNWIVQRHVQLIPWRLFESTVFQSMALRALGARIGERVHIHRGVDLTQGGWDLLDIGDDVTVDRDASLQLVTLEDRQMVIGSVVLGRGATIEVRAGAGANTRVGKDALLSSWSFLPAGENIPEGERWDGVPAKPAGTTTVPPPVDHSRDLSSITQGCILVLGRMGSKVFLFLPLIAIVLTYLVSTGTDVPQIEDWLSRSDRGLREWMLWIVIVVVGVPLELLMGIAAMRLLGRTRPGDISRWSAGYARILLKTEILEWAGRWLSGVLLWPLWLRAVGMRIGRGCEISTITDTIPELVSIGSETFFADGIHLATPKISRGTVTLASVEIGGSVFVGNHAVINGGQVIPDDVLIGVCTVADDRSMRSGSAWFGLPPFELHSREPVLCDRRLTHDPTWIRYLNRVFWELLRFALPLVPLCAVLTWLLLLESVESISAATLLLVALPATELAALAVPLAFVVASKWLLLGRVKPGTHPLWSCWCSRWDFLYVVWDFCGAAILRTVDGTLLLNVFLRGMGARIGQGVVLGPGFVHIADPDMLVFEDGVTAAPLLQAHTFEDRVLKIDHVRAQRNATVGSGALMLYGADIGEGTYVMPHSVVMKRERLLPGCAYGGCPTHLLEHARQREPEPALNLPQ